MSKFDWAGLLRAGVQRLGLRPDQFWRLTPAELALMLGQGAQVMPLDRANLDALLARFPDEKEPNDGSD